MDMFLTFVCVAVVCIYAQGPWSMAGELLDEMKAPQWFSVFLPISLFGGCLIGIRATSNAPTTFTYAVILSVFTFVLWLICKLVSQYCTMEYIYWFFKTQNLDIKSISKGEMSEEERQRRLQFMEKHYTHISQCTAYGIVYTNGKVDRPNDLRSTAFLGICIQSCVWGIMAFTTEWALYILYTLV